LERLSNLLVHAFGLSFGEAGTARKRSLTDLPTSPRRLEWPLAVEILTIKTETLAVVTLDFAVDIEFR
jgi:hypothetical protein